MDTDNSRRLQVGSYGTANTNWNNYIPYTPPYNPPITYTTYIPRYQMTDSDIDAVADRVIEKLKSELLNTVLAADPKAFMALLLKAVADENGA